jgi:hypothetical protein
MVVTDEFLKLYLARPEVVPPDDACLVERSVYGRLLRDPRAAVPADEIAAMADRDARENWRYLTAFRDALLAHPSLEAAYLALVRAKSVDLPPLFLNQLVHLVARNIFDGEADTFRLRTAEMLWRPQRLTLKDGIALLADEELVDGSNVNDHTFPLVAIFGDAKARDLDILTADNAATYWQRSDGHDLVVDFRHGQPARGAFARVLEKWLAHLCALDVSIDPVERVEEKNWAWFVGLDQEGTRIGNALWNGEEPKDDGRSRIVALYRLMFAEPRLMRDAVAGQPVYLILAMTPNRIVRVKPHNLLVGLPLKDAS